MSSPCGFDNGFRCCLLLSPISNVIGDGIVEEGHFLPDISHLLAKAFKGDRLKLDAIDQDIARCRVIESREEPDQGGFTATGVTHQCNGFSFWNNEIDALKNKLTLGAVSEANLSQFDIASPIFEDLGALILLSFRI